MIRRTSAQKGLQLAQRLGCALWLCWLGACQGGEPSQKEEDCVSTRQLFAQTVWPLMNAKCTGCHAPGGTAVTGDNAKQRAAGFVLEWDAYPDFLDMNLESARRMTQEQIAGVPKLLLKATGGDSHLGGAPVAKDSDEYRALEALVTQLQEGGVSCPGEAVDALAGVQTEDWAVTFRRAAVLLGGRLPTEAEQNIADEAAFDQALTTLMSEPGFLQHVKETWNDVLLTEGGARVQVGAGQFRPEDFPGVLPWLLGPTVVCKGAPNYNQCAQNFYLYWGTVQRGLLREPLEIIAHVVAKNSPFREVLTADYTLVNPYTAAVYGAQGLFDPTMKDAFDVWKEAKLVATQRGPVAHAGVLTTPAFLGRWVSTETNKGRARSRVLYKAFLATDLLKLAQRPVDTAALTGVANPPRNASACSVCHTLLDPVASAFGNYPDSAGFDYDSRITAATNRHQEMLPPGFSSQRIPGQEARMLPALSQLVVQDPRFALSVARVAYRGVMGREVLRYPADPQAADFSKRLAAWAAQDRFLHSLVQTYLQRGERYQELVRALIKSPFFRATSPQIANPFLAAEVGFGRLLSPEQLDRKIEAVSGIPWSMGGWGVKSPRIRDLRDRYSILYGGIDSFAVTARASVANPMIAQVAERMGNEVACKTVAWEFTRPAAQRVLLPKVERHTAPSDGEGERRIRDNIVHLFQRVLGERVTAQDPEVDAAFALFRDTVDELNDAGKPDYLPYYCLGLWDRSQSQIYPCGDPGDPDYVPECYTHDKLLPSEQAIGSDPVYTIGGWMAVISYLFSDVRFLYE